MKKKENKKKVVLEKYTGFGYKMNKITFLLVFYFLPITILYSQTEKITLIKKNVAIEDVLKEIRKQTGLNYFLNHEEIPKEIKITIDIKNAPIEEALDKCFENLNISYKIIDNTIIIIPKKKKENIPVTQNNTLNQNIKGNVYDLESQFALVGAMVVVKETEPALETITDNNGNYKIGNVPIGRYTIEYSFLGYEPFVIKEVLVGSSKEIIMNIGLRESITQLDEIKIKAYSNKEQPINSMSTLSSRQINVEEANRYAGGFDDPARLITSFAGVTYSVGNNSVVIRGNSPKGLLWMMEGIQISNPNHFGDYISLGGGAVTAISSHTMANSDFFSGAFPAEYSNALSGVFDISLRTGNNEKREHTFQSGLIGIDYASEGPFVKGKKSTYLFNYRYSTLGLVSPILPRELGILTYQDFSFKLFFPVKKIGVISIWGIGAYDRQFNGAEADSTRWENTDDRKEFEAKLLMGAIGISHKKILNNKTYFHTTFAPTMNSFDYYQSRYDDNLILQPKTNISDIRWKYALSSFVNHKFNARHTNKTGFILNRLYYDIYDDQTEEYSSEINLTILENGSSNHLQFYTQSKFNITNNIIINIGLHSQYFALNENYTLEPRFGARWNFNSKQTIGIAYGLHAQLEPIQIYLTKHENENGKILPNKNLDFNKTHHFIMCYTLKLSENSILKVEPYYQKLFSIPVLPDSYISTINMVNFWNFNDSLINTGTGRNFGIDFSLERYFNNNYYYMITTSLFDSKYKGGDNILRNTKYNKNYVINLLGGREWYIGSEKNNILGINFKLSYMGGDRIHPVNYEESYTQQDIIEDTSRAYSRKLPDAPILSFSVNYKKNKLKYSSTWSLHLMNALCHKEFQEYIFNLEDNTIEEKKDLLIIPNISYKIEF